MVRYIRVIIKFLELKFLSSRISGKNGQQKGVKYCYEFSNPSPLTLT
jgi:hypothetical protein